MELTALILVSSIILISTILLLLQLQRRRRTTTTTRRKQTIDGAPLKFTYKDLVKNGYRFLDWTTEMLLSSPTNTITMPSNVATSNPSNIEHILKYNFTNYPKGHNITDTLHDLLGDGIFNTDGDHWKFQRKIASLQFNTKSIRSFVTNTVQLEVTTRLLPLLTAAAVSGESIDLQDTLERFSFDNVCKVAFDVDPARLAGDAMDGGRFARAFDTATEISVSRFQQPRFFWLLRRKLNLGEERRLKEGVRSVNEFAMKVVHDKKLRGKAGDDDLLSKFIEDGSEHSDEFLRDIIISFVLAGRDTTSSALTWFFWLVSSRPEIRGAIRDEVSAVRAKHGSEPGQELKLEELREMEYLHAALSETLRLYPPVALEPRECLADDTLPDGTEVKKGWSVMYNSYAMGRMEGIWGEDCMEFRPERWLVNGEFQAKSPFKFPIFHAGPRTCLGKEMAYIQMKAVAASVLERFELEMAPGEEKKRAHGFTIVLRMNGGLPMVVRNREIN